MKICISAGDSFTYGAELPDDYIGPSKHAWSNLISDKLGAKHINTAASGRSNAFMSRRVIYYASEYLKQYNSEEIFVQVMWTFVARREFKLINGTLGDKMHKADSEWLALDPYTADNEAESTWFKKVSPNAPNYESTKNTLERKFNLYKDAGIVDLAKSWYKVISDEDDTYASLKEILLLQEFLNKRNIRYIFTYVGYHIPKQLFDDETNQYVSNLRTLIDKDRWYTFPGQWNESQYIGFDDWAKLNKYEYATSHPLEKAHSDAAGLIYEHIKKIL